MQIQHGSRHELFSHVDVVQAVSRPDTAPATSQWSHTELFREPAGSPQDTGKSA
jgi:hypothetical protein